MKKSENLFVSKLESLKCNKLSTEENFSKTYFGLELHSLWLCGLPSVDIMGIISTMWLYPEMAHIGGALCPEVDYDRTFAFENRLRI